MRVGGLGFGCARLTSAGGLGFGSGGGARRRATSSRSNSSRWRSGRTWRRWRRSWRLMTESKKGWSWSRKSTTWREAWNSARTSAIAAFSRGLNTTSRKRWKRCTGAERGRDRGKARSSSCSPIQSWKGKSHLFVEAIEGSWGRGRMSVNFRFGSVICSS